MALHKIPLAVLAEKSADPFPIVDNIWNMFARKGNKTVFLSIGASKSCLPDLELAETLGCPFHVVPTSAAERAQWEEVAASLKARSRPADARHEFSAGAEEKWILPKNFRVGSALPWWLEGTVALSGETIHARPFFDVVQDMSRAMNLPETRLDILKVDVGAGLERAILMAMLEHNLRPAILMVRWSYAPDENVPTSITAGHLQNSGYSLIHRIDDKFLYFFTDQDLYMTCSWEDMTAANPLVKQLVLSLQTSAAKVEGAGGNANATTETALPPSGEAVHESSDAPTANGS